MQTTFTIEYDQMSASARESILASLTGDDRDAILAAEQAYNTAVERLTGTNPGVRFGLSDGLDELARNYRHSMHCDECGRHHEDGAYSGACAYGDPNCTESATCGSGIIEHTSTHEAVTA